MPGDLGGPICDCRLCDFLNDDLPLEILSDIGASCGEIRGGGHDGEDDRGGGHAEEHDWILEGELCKKSSVKVPALSERGAGLALLLLLGGVSSLYSLLILKVNKHVAKLIYDSV